MPTWTFGPWDMWALWNLGAFGIALIVNSFIEWGAHRFVLHGTTFGRFAYNLHDQKHHKIFGPDITYHAQDQHMRDHITFVGRDYLLFLAFTTPLWVIAELISGKPLVVGAVLATLAGLQAFNSLHYWMHDPADRWVEGTRAFRFLKEHHRLHHSNTRTNYNVVFPLADMLLGTLRRKEGA